MLPIWDRLGGNPKIYRLQTSDGERMLGREHEVRRAEDRVGTRREHLDVHGGRPHLGRARPHDGRGAGDFRGHIRSGSGHRPRDERGDPAAMDVGQHVLAFGLAQEGDGQLQVVALLGVHAQLFAVDLAVDLQLGFLDPGDDLLGLVCRA